MDRARTPVLTEGREHEGCSSLEHKKKKMTPITSKSLSVMHDFMTSSNFYWLSPSLPEQTAAYFGQTETPQMRETCGDQVLPAIRVKITEKVFLARTVSPMQCITKHLFWSAFVTCQSAQRLPMLPMMVDAEPIGWDTWDGDSAISSPFLVPKNCGFATFCETSILSGNIYSWSQEHLN